MLDPKAGERLRWALELATFAENLMRLRFQRDFPRATEEEIEQRLLRWMRGVGEEESRPRPALTTEAGHRSWTG